MESPHKELARAAGSITDEIRKAAPVVSPTSAVVGAKRAAFGGSEAVAAS